MSVNEETETHADTPKKDPNVQISSKVSKKDFSRNVSVTENSKLSQNNTRPWDEEDPLEGPSWLFNNTMPLRDNEPEEIESDSDVNNNTSQAIVYDDSSVTESNEEASNLNESTSKTPPSERDAALIADRSESDSSYHEANGSIGELLPATTTSNRERSSDNEDSNPGDTMKFASFVTLRRGHSETPEETVEDFTLMLRQPAQNMQFNINELRLPVLEESSVINNSAVNNENDTELTAAIPRVTNIPVASVSNRSLNESDCNHITIKLPLILINDHKRMPTPQKTKHSSKSVKKSNTKERASPAENSSTTRSTAKPRNTRENSRDPSTAKVVLEKLNESHVKSRRSSNDIQTSTNNLMYV